VAVLCGGTVNICRVRVTKLDANGNVDGTTNNQYVTDLVTEVTLSPNVETGDTINQKNGCGCSVIRYKVEDSFNFFEFSFTEVGMEPALQAMMLGADTIENGADVVGVAFGGALDCSETRPWVAFEFWTQHVVGGSQDATYPWIHWAFPGSLWQLGDNTLAEGVGLPVLNGFSRGNANWGDGPYGDGPPDGQDITEGGWWKTADEPPAATCATGNVTPSS
jgi:hypothetical protein